MMLVYVDASLMRLSQTNFKQICEMIICSDRYINKHLTSLISILLYLNLVSKSLTGESSFFCLCWVVASRKEQLRTGHLQIDHVAISCLYLAADHMHICIAGIRGLQRNVVYLGWPIAPSYMSPNAGEWRGGCGVSALSTAVPVHRSPNKLGRSNYIYNLWQASSLHQETVTLLPLEAKRIVYRLHSYRYRNIKNVKVTTHRCFTEALQICIGYFIIVT